MIPELGHFALVMALLVALAQAALPYAGAARGNAAWMNVARPASRLQFGFLLIAFASLEYAFVTNDFSVLYVAQNSNSSLPLAYRMCALWGAHEGSLLLWVTILGLWGMLVSWFSRNLPLQVAARVLATMGLVSVGFLMFMLLTSNPFQRLFPAPPDGADLNPLLQDPGMIVHPPMLYTGYVGFSVVFGFAIAALLGRRLDPAWARWSRPWTIMAWTFLTAGITLGSYWSYYELGWGGWWFWDPVENASFMPWLVGTALIHSLAATEKRGVFKNWTVLLAICAFSLSLLGTFLVRSGVLNSVHAFASDPARGVFILALLGIVIGGSLLLYALRAPGTVGGGGYSLVSRETLLLANSLLLVVAMGAVFLGTIYPLVIEALGGKISVGAPYFNAVFVPLMVPLLVAIGFGMIARWKKDEWLRIWRHARRAAVASLVLGVLLALMLFDMAGAKVGFAILLGAWILITTGMSFYERIARLRTAGNPLRTLPGGFLGMCLAHAGLAVTLIGIAVSSNYSVEAHKRMGVGDREELAGYTFELASIHGMPGPNYRATEATVKVYRGDRLITELHSQKRLYNVRGMTMTEAGIDGGVTRDFYVSLGEPLDGGDWSIRLYYKPFVRLIWIGALFMVIGGLFAVSDRRYRTVPAAAPDALRGMLPDLPPRS